jgi:putative ABC transport system permease protein
VGVVNSLKVKLFDAAQRAHVYVPFGDSFQPAMTVHVRIALGATAADVMRLVMSEGVRLIAAGLCIGLPLSAGVSRILAGLVYGVRAFEPAVFAGAALLLTAAMLVACYVPAQRATGVPPVVALRND